MGLKCTTCSGVRTGRAARHRRRPAVVVAGAALVAAIVAFGSLRGGSESRPAEREVVAGRSFERDVELIRPAGARIAGTLRLPERSGRGQVPAALIIPGFGPTDRDGVNVADGQADGLYRDLSERLATAGVASFRYDKRGTGRSALPREGRLSFDDMAADAGAGIDFLSERSEVDGDALVAVGHDEGALLAMRVAASDPRVKALVLVSSPGRPLVDVIADDFRATHGEARADELRAVAAGLMATGELPPPEALPADLRGFFPRDQVGYLREIFAIDPVAYARQVHVPVLVVRGERATFTTAADAQRLVEALGPRAELLVAPGAGPTLAPAGRANGAGGHTTASTSDHGASRTNPERAGVLDRISSWLAGRLAAPTRR
ncbi:MAG: lysophospholipase [Actinomycetota bacterium]|nr:lysophospholipase [Actinomycetota bacterium]